MPEPRPQFSQDELKQLADIFRGNVDVKIHAAGGWILMVANLAFRILEELQKTGGEPMPPVPPIPPAGQPDSKADGGA